MRVLSTEILMISLCKLVWKLHCLVQSYQYLYLIITWLHGFLAQNCSGCPWQPLMAGCVKLQLPASSSRMRHNGERVPVAVLVAVSICFIVIMLKPVTCTSERQSHVCLWWLMIPYKWFGETNHSSCMNWPHSCTCLTMFLVHSDPSWQDVQSYNSRH